MNKLFSGINKKIFFFILVSLVIQVALAVFFWNNEIPPSDAASYVELAEDCVKENVWYPAAKHLYSSYLFAPGLVNLLVILIRLFGTWKAVIGLNILFNLGITGCIYAIGKRFFDEKVGYVAVILWSLLYSNWFAVLSANTEIPFLFFVLAAFTLCVVRSSSNWTYVLAGILLIIGNYIRPLSILFLVTIVAYMILQHARTLHYCGLILPCVLGAILLGQVSKNNTGVFAFQSSTSGVNLIMTSHDEAYGGVNTTILSDTTSICYINEADKLTFVEKDAIWKSRAIQWIKDHPAKASFLYIKKLFGLWVEDSWSDRPVIGGGGAVDRGINGGDRSAFIRQILHMMSCSIVYYLVLILFVVGLIKERSLWIKNRKTEGVLLFLLAMGIGTTCLFSVSSRYHYPFLFIVVLFASRTIVNFLERKNYHV